MNAEVYQEFTGNNNILMGYIVLKYKILCNTAVSLSAVLKQQGLSMDVVLASFSTLRTLRWSMMVFMICL